MSNVILSPSARAKTKTIEAANKIKHGSPKLQEVLRKRCRERLREKRGQLFNGRRLGLDSSAGDVQETLSGIVRKEFEEIISTDWDEDQTELKNIFESLLELEETISMEDEIMAIEEQWIVEEYNRELEKEEGERLSQDVVFCPICQKTALQKSSGFIKCDSCFIQFSTEMNLEDFQKKMLNFANDHMLKCNKRPVFTVMPYNDIAELYLACESCDSFISIDL